MADVIRGREAYGRQEWGSAHAALTAADHESPLELEDLERLAATAYLIGREEEAFESWTRAHHECERIGDIPRAVRCAFWLGFALANKGDMARASGWLSRSSRLLDECGQDCVERGYLLFPVAFTTLMGGDVPGAHAKFAEAARIGEQFRDVDLVSLARNGEGRALIYMGDIPGGVALLDEAMVAIAAGEVSPIIAGDVYCSMIEACSELFDMRRAHEWTAALSNWCEGQPDLVLYRGQCLIHRAEIMQLHGEWPDAMHEIELARARLADPPSHMAIGSACYQQGELFRLVGEFASAEDAYRAASQAGHEPQPGWALLRLAQGQTDAAAAAIRRIVDEADDPSARSRMLPACVEILLAVDDAHTARFAADELTKIAAELDAPLLHATSAHATGAVLLAEGDARAALVALRTAWSRWRELDVPYEAARVRVLLGLACRALGDEDSAEMEFDAARSVFDQLHAASELQRVDALSGRTAAKDAGGLSTREIEVIALVATGKTNKAIATELIISEKTVARHVSNIFTKLGVSSRAAATAYAYEHDLVQH